jgi:hypothetical protein
VASYSYSISWGTGVVKQNIGGMTSVKWVGFVWIGLGIKKPWLRTDLRAHLRNHFECFGIIGESNLGCQLD